MTPERRAIQLMIGQAVLFAAETAVIHQIGSRMSVMQIALIRGAAGLALALLLARQIGFAVVRTRQLPLQIVRGAVSAAYLWVMIYSFGHLPFADATAISYTQAAYIALFSVLILGEAVGRWRWTAAAVGIFGALLVAKPEFGGGAAAYLVAIVGTSLNGLSFVLNRYLQREDSETTTMFYSSLVPALANAPVLLVAGLPSPETLAWLPALALLGPVGLYFGIVAVKHASAAMLGPYTLLRLVIALAVGVLIFRERPDAFSFLGAALIIASCLVSTWSGGLRRRPFVGGRGSLMPAAVLVRAQPR